ncbi:energy transducer TonB [Seonamhaeicola maritimus]|uniref:energy transducer TonB n=1 Tax=Seonamhaeicola maritimus TaxID=2591822 RepID=UPI001F4FDB5E|nr:energy transducer TonB [Seonamhaeicola maritimus]
MFQYIIQTIAFQLFFLMVYDFFLKKETFFNWNRAYLLGTALLSLLIPLIKIEGFKNVVSPEYIITLPEVLLGNAEQQADVILLDPAIISQKSFWTWEMLFLLGAFIAALLFGFKLIKMLVMLAKNPKHKVNNFHIVKLLNSSAAFSFFRYIFLGDKIHGEDKKAILKHEMVHVKQYHSVDLLLLEILRILFWFNPLIYMYQNRVVALHEFIADAHAVNPENRKAYYQNLLAQVFDTKKISFINPFFKQSLIKKRIVMLTKSKSKQINLLKYALLIPLVFGMLIYTSAQTQDKLGISKEDLSEYTYSVNAVEVNSDKLALKTAKEAQKKQADFIKLNPSYVVWVDYNDNKPEFTYSLHHESEKIPEDYSLRDNHSEGGLNYRSYVHNVYSKGNEKKYLSEIDVPFAVIEQVPVFPGCEGLTKEEQRQCMSKNISQFVNKNFNTKIATEYKLTGRQRINVIFKIDKEGNITGVRSRAPHPALEEEAIRVIKLLPKMIPGMQKGKVVNVPYSLPIIFQVADSNKFDKYITVDKLEESAKLNLSINRNDISVPFALIDQVPVFPGCEGLTKEEQRQCMSKNISQFVNKNFNTKIATEHKLTGRQRINVIFKINKEGNIADVRSRAPHPALEEEAIRVIKSLPKMIPGMQKGKVVNVPYSLPIIFQVADDNPEGKKE